MRLDLTGALIGAALMAVLAVPILGININVDGTRMWLTGNVTPVLIAMLAVFGARLVHAPLARLFGMVRLGSIVPSSEHMAAYRPAILAVLVGVAIIWPFTASRGAVDIATLAMIYVMLGLGLNIVVGFAGLLDLGYVAFYAVGAYSYALLSEYFGLGFWTCLPISGAFAALFGFVLGFPVLRLRGDYLAIVTLGFGEIIRLLLNNWDALTGGPDGIDRIPKPTLFGLEFTRRARVDGNVPFHEFFALDYSGSYRVIFVYLLAVLLVLATLYVINRLIRMPIGRAWEALREDEIAARSLGLNPTIIKLSAFTLGASFAGFAGCFFAARQGFINPESFTFIESAIVLAIVVLGGMGSQVGVILAAVALTALPEIARQFQEFRMLIFGLVMVLMMIWRPQGLLPSQRRAHGSAYLNDALPLLAVRDLSMRFGGLLAVDKVSLDVAASEVISVIGPNGAGKTTVFNCISGFYRPTDGAVRLDGDEIQGLPTHRIARRGVVRTFQNVRLFTRMTVVENLLVAQHTQVNSSLLAGLLKLPGYRRSESEALERAAFWLDKVGLREAANREAGNLAYGQQRRLEIARCMVTSPKVLMLDEPAAGLNPRETKELDELILSLRGEHQVSVLLIEHDMKLVMEISDRVYVIDQGSPLASGTPSEVQNDPRVIKAYLGES